MKQALLFAAMGALALAACSGADQQVSDLPSSPGIQAAPPVSQSCAWRDAGTYAKNYFSLRDDKQLAASYLSDAEKATPGSALRNDLLFNVFKLVESARAAGNVAAGAEAQGANLVAVLVKDYAGTDCGSFTVSHNDQFLLAVLTEALTNGAFAYRNGAEGFAATEDGGAALWTADFNTWVGGRSMVFGAKWTTGFGNEVLVGTFSYRFGLIFDASSHGPTGNGNDDVAVVELCEAGVDYSLDPRYRVGRVRASGIKTVLQTANISGFCDTPPTAPQGNVVSRVLRGVKSFFAPTTLLARRAPPGMSGSVDDLSDFIGVNALVAILSYDTQPTTGVATEPFLVRLHARTNALNDFEDVPITIAVANNQGTPAGAFLTAVAGCGLTDDVSLTKRTNELGVASFCVMVNKPGGYKLEANHELVGFAPSPTLSDAFNRTGN